MSDKKLTQEEFEAELQRQLQDTTKMVASIKMINSPIWEFPIWQEMLNAVAEFKRNGYKITYWDPKETIFKASEFAVPLVEGETESVIIIAEPKAKLPKLKCHHYHLITLAATLEIQYVEL